MIQLLIISALAITYAFRRGWHDKDLYENQGDWKVWATIMTGVVAIMVVIPTVAISHWPWWMFFPCIVNYTVIFWLFFDCWMGYLKGGNIFYLGTGKWDTWIKPIIAYNETRKAVILVAAKLFLLSISIPSYFSFIKNVI